VKEIVKTTIESLKKNNIKAYYFTDIDSAADALLDEIVSDGVVGIGGSLTVKSLAIAQKLIQRGNKVFWHWLEDTPERQENARKEALLCDVYITSTNALTQKGQLVNTDGTGNRVASMIFGPKKVIIVCGTNKIVKDLDEALERIKTSAVMNAKRLGSNTPCVTTGKCTDCNSENRICRITTIIDRKPFQTEMTVMIIDKELGY
jgi:L-lactate utilization protein LutC